MSVFYEFSFTNAVVHHQDDFCGDTRYALDLSCEVRNTAAPKSDNTIHLCKSAADSH